MQVIVYVLGTELQQEELKNSDKSRNQITSYLHLWVLL